MALLASDIIARVRHTLLDASGVAWADAELLSYLNGGLTQLVSLKPDAYPKVASVSLVAGVWQDLPADGVLFLDAIANTSGSGVTVEAAHEFVRVHPDWAAATASANIRYVLFDPRLPTKFNVYPPAATGAALVVKYGAKPDRLTATSDSIAVPDWFETPLWAFAVASAYAKNSKRQDLAKFGQFMGIFTNFVVGNTPSERTTAAIIDPQGVA